MPRLEPRPPGRASKKTPDRHGTFQMTENVARVLVYLKTSPYPAVSAPEVARALEMTVGSVRRTLHRLVEAGWVREAQWSADTGPRYRPRLLYSLRQDGSSRATAVVFEARIRDMVAGSFPDHPVRWVDPAHRGPLRMTPLHRRLLFLMAERNPVPLWAGDIHEALGIHDTTPSGLLRSLQDHGLAQEVLRQDQLPGRRRPRARYFRLTPKGLRAAVDEVRYLKVIEALAVSGHAVLLKDLMRRLDAPASRLIPDLRELRGRGLLAMRGGGTTEKVLLELTENGRRLAGISVESAALSSFERRSS